MRPIEALPCAFPATLTAALAELTRPPRPVLLAGGTDLMAQWSAGAPLPDRVVSIHGLTELMTHERRGDQLVLGAGLPHAQLAASPSVRRDCPALAAAAATVGGAQIQARGTLGGNLINASPAGDLSPALLITGGTAVLISAARGERHVPLADFFTGYRQTARAPDEILLRLELPVRPPAAVEHFIKLGPRRAQAISKIMLAARLTWDGQVLGEAAIALGSVAPTAVLLTDLTRWLTGRAINPSTRAAAATRARAAVKPIDDIRSTARYRRWATGQLVARILSPPGESVQ